MARRFNGTSNYVTHAGAVLTDVPITLACWFNTTSLAATQSLIGIYKSSATGNDYNRYEIQVNLTTGKIRAALGMAGGITGGATSTLGASANEWNHAIGVFVSAIDRRAFLNGGNKGTDAANFTPSGLDVTTIGKRDWAAPAQYMSGMIASPAIWNVALTDTEVAALAHGVSPLRIRPAALVGYWPIAGVGAVELDAVGNNNMLVTGATVAGDPPMIRSIIRKRRFYLIPAGVIYRPKMTPMTPILMG